jgi:two-component system sensor histidine kinase PhoQ
MLLVASVVLFLFLGMVGGVLDQAFRRSAADGVSERLLLHIYGLLAATEEVEGRLVLPEALQEPGFNRLGTGLYAIVLEGNGREIWRSESAIDLSVPPQSKVNLYSGTIAGEPRFGYVINDEGVRVFFLSYRVLWQGAANVTHPYVFAVLQTRETYLREVGAFRESLWGWLVGVMILLIGIQAAVMSWGLAPLRRLERDLLKIEEGEEQYLEGEYPDELDGVTRNLNLLLANEREQRERYRTTLADLAHSLKTPLAILRGASSALIYKPQGGEEDVEGIRQTVDEQVERMNEIVGYQLERAVSTSSNLIRRAIDVEPVAEQLIAAMRKVYEEKAIEIELNLAESEFFGDERDLMELLGNIVDNACKYGRNRVRVEVGKQYDRVVLVVEDDGPGITAEHREAVLDRGARLDAREPGQGIGLAVVQEIIARYGGELSIDGSVLGGARLTVTLP